MKKEVIKNIVIIILIIVCIWFYKEINGDSNIQIAQNNIIYIL